MDEEVEFVVVVVVAELELVVDLPLALVEMEEAEGSDLTAAVVTTVGVAELAID